MSPRRPRDQEVLRLAVIGGDGIGPEVTDAALRVLDAAADRFGFAVQAATLDLNADSFLATGRTLTADDLKFIENYCDGVLFGAIGDPRVPDNQHAREILLGLRTRLNLYVNLRPAHVLDERLCPLKGKTSQDVRLSIVRELTEDLYVGIGGRFARLGDDETGIDVMLTTRAGVERVILAAADLARETHGRRLCVVHKTNAIEGGHKLWTEVPRDLQAQLADVNVSTMHVDVAAMELVRAPEQFDVVVTNNMFGDILSDLAAQLQGGLGLAPSLSYRPDGPCLAEPVHGSAPLLAGTGKANPLGAIRSAGLLLHAIGFVAASAAIEDAVTSTLLDDTVTPDLGGNAETDEVTDAVINWLQKVSK